ncbi:DUF459 domain-containing protein [Acinetobacter sp. 251-1]|uniref:SGNH/GDSL hydrolase family protein n=1 Tax=Acinetobacter sp. 251-1 TaxID=2746720 RepID=UPI002577C7CA|nr:DUF459 domain-containing protein [Acinetobacter sp. 251-1]MDM1760098.1 DUF459 domain-containing protein [Acinetobacter sp. 251-1]
MPTSNPSEMTRLNFDYDHATTQDHIENDHWQGVLYTVVFLVVTAVLGIWMMQNSVNAYYQQTYHQDSPLKVLDKYPMWQKGGELGTLFYAEHNAVKNSIQQHNQYIVDTFNHDYAYTTEYKQQLVEKAKQEKIRLAKEAAAREHQNLLNQFSLTKNDQVFFAGDSLMQGVAPFVQKYLLENYDIKTVNLSKQSTGLSYPSFFDWPKTIQETIVSHPEIKILVVFLGPNDPWDMPNPKGGTYLKFKSPEWEAVYRSRIKEIIDTAQQHNVRVMWLTPPNMRKPQLNEQMIYLNQVVADQVQKSKAFFIDSRPILGNKNNVYSDYLVKDGQSIKMRSADGIHFSAEGQKAIANVISQHLNVIQ